jgi:plastocyanin
VIARLLPTRLSGATLVLVLVLVLGALALGGCGLAVGPAPSAVRLLVTSEYGQHVLHRSGTLHASEGETVESLLTDVAPVRTSSRGGHVASIDGLSATAAKLGEPAREWSYYVNGVQVHEQPAKREVNPGDHVWWDLHPALHTAVTQALVGAYPEPFLNGVEGRRLPIRVECASVSHSACTTVTESLRRAGVPAAVAAIGSGGAPETLRVMVGPWVYLESDLEAQSIARGPQASGVYVRIPTTGRRLELLDQHGQTVQTLGAGAGLVAATTASKEAPVWVITGTDATGVELAARSLDSASLEDRFAVAFQAGASIALPLPTPPTG